MEAGDIVKVSIPLVAGMAAGALLCNAAGTAWRAAAAGISLAAGTALIAGCVFTRRRAGAAICAAYLLLGLFCYCSRSLLPPLPRGRKLDAGWLSGLIDALPFSSERTSPLVKALLTGDRSGLARDTIDSFRASGASHILALSGLHLGVIYLVIARVFSIFGRSGVAVALRSLCCITLCGLYTSMTGAGPSIVRAFLFITIRETARLMPERRISSLSVYALALTVQTVLNPLVITSVGFQLSYLAMLGIFTVFPVLESWYPATRRSARFDPVRKIWVSAALAISCQLFTGPLAWLRFGTFPKYFLLTNLIALPLTEGLIVSALGAVILSSTGIGEVFVRATDLLAGLMMDALDVIAGM